MARDNKKSNEVRKVKLVKLIIAIILLAGAQLVLIMGLDLAMGTKVTNSFKHVFNTFAIMEPAESILLVIFAFILLLQIYVSFRNRKKRKKMS